MPCAPFSDPVGMTLGEGAGFVVVEGRTHARERGVREHCVVAGFGMSADTYHRTSPDPSGRGIASALSSALQDAGMAPEDVGYCNAHGTGTLDNDAAEWLGIRAALGPHAERIPVSSNKSFLGHSVGAAGVIETIVTVMGLQDQVVAPTLHFAGPRRVSPTDPVAELRPRPWTYSCAVSVNAAFGGANAALVLCTPAVERVPRAAERSVVLCGLGLLTPLGVWSASDLGSVADCVLVDGVTPAVTEEVAVPHIDLSRLVDTNEARGLDPLEQYATAVCALASNSARPHAHVPGERIGIVMGASQVPETSTREFCESARRRGNAAASTRAFARVVMNAAAGSAARIMGFRGPNCTLAHGPGAGLAALEYAVGVLRRGDAGIMFAAAVDELGPERRELHTREQRPGLPGGGGASVMLMDEQLADGSSLARIAGTGVAGPGALAVAIAKALGAASMTGVDAVLASAGYAEDRAVETQGIRQVFRGGTPLLHMSPLLGYSESVTSLAAVAAAAALLHGRKSDAFGKLSSVLVTTVSAMNCSTAVVLRGMGGVGCMDSQLQTYIQRRQELTDRLKRILIKTLNMDLSVHEIDDDVVLFGSGLGLDSIDAVEIAFAVEEELRTKLWEDEDVRTMRTLNTLVDHVLAQEKA